MLYQWEFRPYQRRFKQALQTSHRRWTVREGILLRFVDEAGNIGWGEIAPIPWFGSETLEQALTFCHQLPATLTDDRLFAIPDTLPASQFGFESAWEGMGEAVIDTIEPQRRRDAEKQASSSSEKSMRRPQNSVIAVSSSEITVQNLVIGVPGSDVEAQNSNGAVQNSVVAVQNSNGAVLSSNVEAQNSNVAIQNSKLKTQNSSPHTPHSHSALLPAGEAALNSWKPLWEQGFRTFKWKIGVQPIATELELLHSLTQSLPASAKLRLDANGGLSLEDAAQWLETCDAIAADPSLSVAVEYLEQPLDISQFQAMQDLSDRYTTPIALDESVATLQQLQTCYASGWRGIFVIKPAIVGSPARLRQFCQVHAIDAVFSSAFETAIGRQAGLQLAAELGNSDRALGYGTAHWFDEAERSDFEQLWQR